LGVLVGVGGRGAEGEEGEWVEDGVEEGWGRKRRAGEGKEGLVYGGGGVGKGLAAPVPPPSPFCMCEMEWKIDIPYTSAHPLSGRHTRR